VYDLDPNAPAWQRFIERDAALRFDGPPSTIPFGTALYLWGNTAIYCIRFGRWTPRSADAAVAHLQLAHAEVGQYMPDGHLACYVQLPPTLSPVALSALELAFTPLPFVRTTVLITSIRADWSNCDILKTLHF
jgi:hypothetical protein